MKKYITIDAYIKTYPKPVQAFLQKIRETVRKVAPSAEEKISYGIPTFVLEGNLVHFGGFKSHVGLFPGASGVAAFEKELKKYETSKGTIQFPLDTPIPTALITKIVKFRIKENIEKAKARAPKNVCLEYHTNGTLWAKGKMSTGKMDGYWEWFRKDGVKMRSGYFKQGIQTGEWTTYDKTGAVYKVTQMNGSRTTNKLKK